jgi:hypothetical protein
LDFSPFFNRCYTQTFVRVNGGCSIDMCSNIHVHIFIWDCPDPTFPSLILEKIGVLQLFLELFHARVNVPFFHQRAQNPSKIEILCDILQNPTCRSSVIAKFVCSIYFWTIFHATMLNFFGSTCQKFDIRCVF